VSYEGKEVSRAQKKEKILWYRIFQKQKRKKEMDEEGEVPSLAAEKELRPRG